ncbi:APC family permease [Vibrio maerlii]|uniref:APC family permease n=1 Tax=Vibrio maerlii TaxID=2231648 RepID=UPI000E3D1C3A|nr:APC family permease [Vibrio maerlii]
MNLGFKELVTIGLGLIIGGGVITVTGYGIGYTDTGISLAYLVAGIAFIFSMIPTLIVGLTIPRTSFSYTVTNELMSPFAGGMFLWIFFIGRIIMAFFGVAFASYVTSILPDLNATYVAVGAITLFYVINLLGAQSATKIQKVLNVVLIVALVSFSALGIMKLQPDALTAERLFPNGSDGFISAVTMLMFSMGGGLVLLEFGGMVKEPQKVLFKAILTVTAIATVLFACIGLAGSGVLPYEQVANKPMTYAAETIFGNEAGVLFFVIGGALMALATTMNSSYMWYCNTMIKGCEDGWFPTFLAKKNRFGTPYILLTIFWLMGVAPVIAGMDIGVLVRVATGLALLFFAIPNFALLGLPSKYPQEWQASRFYIKSKAVLVTLTVVCNAVFLGLIFKSFSGFSSSILTIIAATVGVGVIYILFKNKQMKAQQQLTPATEV